MQLFKVGLAGLWAQGRLGRRQGERWADLDGDVERDELPRSKQPFHRTARLRRHVLVLVVHTGIDILRPRVLRAIGADIKNIIIAGTRLFNHRLVDSVRIHDLDGVSRRPRDDVEAFC